MKRTRRSLRLWLLGLCVSSSVGAQTVGSSPPALSTRAGSFQQQGPLQPPSSLSLPVGHPPIDEPFAGSASDELEAPARAMADDIADDAALAPGTVIVKLEGFSEQDGVKTTATLETLTRSSSRVQAKRSASALVSSKGEASFTDLSVSDELSFRVQVAHKGIAYGSSPFTLNPSSGKRVSIHIYETTSDIDLLPVGVQSYLLVAARDEYLQMETILRFSNLGTQAWIPSKYLVRLPSGYEGLKADTDSSLEAQVLDGVGLRLTGYVKPGSEDLVFHYRIPYDNSGSAQLHVPLPPRVAHLRVFVENTGKVHGRVEQLPALELTDEGQGRSLWVTELMAEPGDDQISEASITLWNLPKRSPLRWAAALLTALSVAAGLYVAVIRKEGKLERAARNKARQERLKCVLLEQIAGLEQAKASGEVGPETYEADRRRLIEQLERVLSW